MQNTYYEIASGFYTGFSSIHCFTKAHQHLENNRPFWAYGRQFLTEIELLRKVRNVAQRSVFSDVVLSSMAFAIQNLSFKKYAVIASGVVIAHGLLSLHYRSCLFRHAKSGGIASQYRSFAKDVSKAMPTILLVTQVAITTFEYLYGRRIKAITCATTMIVSLIFKNNKKEIPKPVRFIYNKVLPPFAMVTSLALGHNWKRTLVVAEVFIYAVTKYFV